MTTNGTTSVVDVTDTLRRLRAGVELVREVEAQRWGLVAHAVRAGADWDVIAASLGVLPDVSAVRVGLRRFLGSAEAWLEFNSVGRFHGLNSIEVGELLATLEEENEL